MSVDEKRLQEVLDQELDYEKSVRGKRFSTQHEGFAFLSESHEDVSRKMNELLQGMGFLWSKIRDGLMDEEYEAALLKMSEDSMETVRETLRMHVLIEKFRGGVVHEPRE